MSSVTHLLNELKSARLLTVPTMHYIATLKAPAAKKMKTAGGTPAVPARSGKAAAGGTGKDSDEEELEDV
jgi:hypothetical protein